MTIGVAGCSHSGYGYGNPWSHYMKNYFNCQISDVSASGVGNEMMIEKIKYVLDRKGRFQSMETDFFIYQIIEPSRLVLGLYGNDVQKEYDKNFNCLKYQENINCHRRTNGIDYLTIKYGSSDHEINDLLGTSHNVIDFFTNNVLISDFNMNIKVFHTLLAVESLFNFYNKKVLFFSWNVDIIELAKQSDYYHILKKLNIIDGSVEEFAKQKNLKKIDSTHYGSDEHKVIYEEFLHNKIKHFIDNNL